jgi:hypothetical protein
MKPDLSKYQVNPPKKKARRPGIRVIKKPQRNPAAKRKAAKKTAKKNPIPFTAIVANSVRRKKPRRKSRNPSRKVSAGQLGLDFSATPRSAKSWHHKRGSYAYNAAKKRRKARKISSSVLSQNTMSKKRRRGRKGRSRNPVSRGGSRRGRSKNPSRRSRSRSRSRSRNPMPFLKDAFNSNVLTQVAGGIVGGVGANSLVNTFAAPTATRTWSLPFIDKTMLASPDPAVRATFWRENALALAAWKVALGIGVNVGLGKQAPRLAPAMMVGAFLAAGMDLLKAQQVITPDGTLRAGMGYLPGTPTLYTNPAQRFLAGRGGAGRNFSSGRNGMGARVTAGTTDLVARQTEGAFGGAN